VRRTDVFVQLLLGLELRTAGGTPETAPVLGPGVLVELLLCLELGAARLATKAPASPAPITSASVWMVGCMCPP
jgi:hypothetical protein